MSICHLMYRASARKRTMARRALVRRCAVGFCVVTTAASLGVVTGILIAPKSGEETRASLKSKAAKSVAAIEKTLQDKTKDK